jgi:hypothetical protein
MTSSLIGNGQWKGKDKDRSSEAILQPSQFGVVSKG